ncbi:MAG: hypothetical protein WDK95_08205 [Syntrophorhabdaceae bacterium]
MENKVGTSTIPLQKLPLKDKTDGWKKSNVDYFISKYDVKYTEGKTKKDEIKISYNIYNSVFDENDFKYVTDPFKVKDGFPATIQNFNIIKPKIDLLLGEESKRPYNFRVIQTGETAATKLQEKYKQLLTQKILEIASKGGPEDPVTDEELKEVESIQKYMEFDYSDIAEQAAYHTLEYLKEKEEIQDKFVQGFKDGLIAGIEVHYVGVVNGEPVQERINPYYFSYDSSPNVRYIEDGSYAVRRMRMTIPAIYDRLYESMDEKDLNELLEKYENSVKGGSNSPNSFNKIVWKSFDFGNEDQEFDSESIDVWHVSWKSFVKVGFLTYFDEEGEEQVEVVSEEYVASEDENITWDWVTEVWEGYRVGDDIYVGIAPIPNQRISVDNPNAQKLPYIGAVYNNTNTKSKSLVEIMKPLQYMYLIIWYRLEIALARDKGRIINMDITQIPKSMGVTTDKWLHYLSAIGVNFFNPYETSYDIPGREGGKPASVSQFSAADLSMSNTIADHVNLMNKIEEMIGELSGVSRQRQGQVTSSELVGNVERAVIQSSHITEIHFWIHNRVKQKVLEALLEAAKSAWQESGKQKLHYITDDMTRIFMDITDDFLYSDFGIFVTDSTQESRNLEAVRSLLQPAMQNGASLSDVAEVIASNNLTEIRKKLKEIEDKRQQREEEMQQMQNEAQQQMVEAQLQDKEADRELKRYEIDSRNEVALLISENQSETKNMDLNRNGIADVLEGEVKEIEIEADKEIEKDKIQLEMKKLENARIIQKMKDDAAMERELVKSKNATSTNKGK